MSTTLAHSVSGSHGARTGAAPRLGSSSIIGYYRRSTTNKAPRKRTFLVLVTNFDSTLAAPAGAFANNAGMLNDRWCCVGENQDVCGGSGGNDGRGGNNNNKNNGGHGGFGFGDSAPQQPMASLLSQLGQALLGAMVLTAAVAAFPGHSQATTSQSLSASSHSAAARPRSKVLHVSCKGGTLVVPLPAGGDVKAAAPLPRSGPFARSKVVEAPIELSGPEAAFINQRQYFVRESMRV